MVSKPGTRSVGSRLRLLAAISAVTVVSVGFMALWGASSLNASANRQHAVDTGNEIVGQIDVLQLKFSMDAYLAASLPGPSRVVAELDDQNAALVDLFNQLDAL